MDPLTDSPDDSLPAAHPSTPAPCRFRPWLFFPCLVAPGIASIVTFLAANGDNYGTPALLVLMIGSVIAGFVCGIHFARSQNRLSTGLKWAVGVVSVLGCAGGAFAIGMGGCSLVFQAF